MSATRLPRATILAVFNRDGHQCANCSRHDRLTIQHRMNRQMGGSKYRDGIASLMTLCDLCNKSLESDADLAAEGRQKGHKLRSHENPREVAIWIEWAREWRRLDDDGGYVVVADRDAAPTKQEGLFA